MFSHDAAQMVRFRFHDVGQRSTSCTLLGSSQHVEKTCFKTYENIKIADQPLPVYSHDDLSGLRVCNLMTPARFCVYTGKFESNLVEIPQYKFSCNEGHLNCS